LFKGKGRGGEGRGRKKEGMGENGRKIDFQGRGVLEALYNHVIAIKLNQSNKKLYFNIIIAHLCVGLCILY